MEEDSSESPICIITSEGNIRSIQSNIQAQLENFERKVPDTTFLESSICENVREQILNFGDEPHLSKAQNNCRRIFIASELFIGICSIYSHIVDYEFKKIISDMIEWEKFKSLSRKISHKMQLEAKREKYFAKEAQSKLLKSVKDISQVKFDDTAKKVTSSPADDVEEVIKPIGDTESVLRSRVEMPILTDDTKQVSRPTEELEQSLRPLECPETGVVEMYEKKSLLMSVEHELIEDAIKGITPQTINKTLELPFESPLREDSLHNITRNITDIRAEPIMEDSWLQYPISNIPRQHLSLPNTTAEISITEPQSQQKTDDDINQILQILGDQIFQRDLVEIEQPKNLLEDTNKTVEVSKDASVEEVPNDNEKQVDAPEKSESEEWSLPSLEPIEKTRKRHPHLIIDEETIIPDYAARALQLNRNISVQRVQVFEGPPKVLQAISVNHLMTTPGFKSSLFHDTRSSKLSKLYSRHLEVEKRQLEAVLLQRGMREKEKEIVISKKRTNIDIMEEIETRAGMRSVLEKSDAVAETAPEKSRLDDLEISAAGVLPKESIIGIPISRIINATIEPPEEAEVKRINAAPISLTPRTQQLQGKSLDLKTSAPWFLSTKENPPNAKYREFNYVYDKLQNYWSLFESQGMEKCISLREFFSFEQERIAVNFLTVLRIVDKMSIQRRLLLEYKDHEILIRPFESPYVSEHINEPFLENNRCSHPSLLEVFKSSSKMPFMNHKSNYYGNISVISYWADF